jgi:hypothetical protein
MESLGSDPRASPGMLGTGQLVGSQPDRLDGISHQGKFRGYCTNEVVVGKGNLL